VFEHTPSFVWKMCAICTRILWFWKELKQMGHGKIFQTLELIHIVYVNCHWSPNVDGNLAGETTLNLYLSTYLSGGRLRCEVSFDHTPPP